MHLGEPDTKRQRRIVLGIAAFFVLLIFFAFNKELINVMQLGWARLKTLIQVPLNVPEEYIHSEIIMLYNGWGAFFVSLIWIVLVSQQTILPVRAFNFQEVFRTAWHLILWMIRQHGQAIFVRDGKSNSTEADVKREGPGVIVVDYNSAVVLETRISTPGLSRPFSSLLLALSGMLGLSEKPQSPRTRGAGITFTHPRERIRGTVDLRKQFRMQPAVRCYTRDGIEIFANVHSTFTLGQDPDVLMVTYDGEPRLPNLRVITFETLSDGYQRVIGLSDADVDGPDANEINQYYRVVDRTREWDDFPGKPQPTYPTPPPPLGRIISRLQPKYDPLRVFAAVFAQARNSTQEAIAWSELPVRVACDYYREILTQVNYDQLYNFSLDDRTTPFQLSIYRRKLMVRMRSSGILSYRFVFLKSGDRFEIGRVVHESAMRASEAHPLKNSKILRDRGIKVIASGFGDPSPVSDFVHNQRLDAWRATWDRDLQVRMAEGDLRSMKLRSQAHAQALRDLTFSLTKLFEDRPYSDEAIAIRIMQALENVATDAKTRQLLPTNTLDMLRYIDSKLKPDASMQETNGVGTLPSNRY